MIPRTTSRAEWRKIYAAAREWARGDWSRERPAFAELAFGRFGVWGVYPEGYTAQDSARDHRGLGTWPRRCSRPTNGG